jgi:hypothetical protein
VDHAEEGNEPVRRDAIVEIGVERLVVFDATRQIDAANAMTREHLLSRIHLDEVNQQVRCEVAARHDHVAREITNPHCLADCSVHTLVSIAPDRHAERCAVDETQKSVADMKAGIEREPSRINGAKQGKQHGHLDRARRVKPAIAALRPLQPGFVVIKRYGKPAVLHFPRNFLDAGFKRRKGGCCTRH